MRRSLFVTLCAASVLAGGCDGENGVRISTGQTPDETKGVLKVIDTLQCPETLGVLTRKGTAQAAGTVCNYSGPRGAEVSLHLVELDDEPVDRVLDRFEARLAAAMPHTLAGLRASADATTARVEAGEGQAGTDANRTDPRPAGAPDTSGQQSGVSVTAGDETADVQLPGLQVHAEGDRASVRIGRFSINADDAAGTADIRSTDESVSIQAHDDAAEIRTRAPGEATRATYMLTDTTPAEAGWRLVGYEARGPVGGPIVVATVRAKDRDSDGVFDSAKDLVALNVGD